MALLESALSPLGMPCPDFSLRGVDDRLWSLASFEAPLLLVVVMCNHCPYVQAVDGRINALARTFATRCNVVGVNPNDADAYPEDSFAAMKARALTQNFSFPYLHDPTQGFVRALGAVCTPDYFLFDGTRSLRYRGRLDDHWKDPALVTRQDLREAIEALLAGGSPSIPQRPSMGCSIKWVPTGKK